MSDRLAEILTRWVYRFRWPMPPVYTLRAGDHVWFEPEPGIRIAGMVMRDGPGDGMQDRTRPVRFARHCARFMGRRESEAFVEPAISVDRLVLQRAADD